jgi:hypothetical protein
VPRAGEVESKKCKLIKVSVISTFNRRLNETIDQDQILSDPSQTVEEKIQRDELAIVIWDSHADFFTGSLGFLRRAL